ncbi:MAG: flavodoxin family protein [Anaerolineae bacterium]|nr:flavodoxin family protein [Anaerolineae bacterium]
MKMLVVYDSFFGNTEKVAQAIGAALDSPEEVGILRVGDVKPEHLADVEILIVGSPTRGFSPSPDAKAFLKDLPNNSLKGVTVAAFDTRVKLADVNSRILPVFVKVFGYAAKPIADRLEKKGGNLALPPEGFFVADTEGPMKEGEIERAAEWAKQILATR